jgi:hypothetical protein
MARMNRAFMQRATRWVAGQDGVHSGAYAAVARKG